MVLGVPREDTAVVGVPRVDTAVVGVPRVDTAVVGVPRVDTAVVGVPRVDTAVVDVPRVDTAVVGYLFTALVRAGLLLLLLQSSTTSWTAPLFLQILNSFQFNLSLFISCFSNSSLMNIDEQISWSYKTFSKSELSVKED